ncbi:conserved hypothetical protein [Ricinus communis]|uniref:Uncharacterized protein n=1 Tax=Ricinus communis TaxID=3988 RepID=B9SL46_RICCO|nr:conserved hypothetical protein [Ricinus communis]
MGIRLEHSDKYQLLRTIKGKIVVMMHLSQLFEIFERACNQLAAFLKLERSEGSEKQVCEEVAWIMKEAGFTVKHEDLDLSQYEVDMVRDFRYRSKYTQEELLERCKNGKNVADMRLSVDLLSFLTSIP